MRYEDLPTNDDWDRSDWAYVLAFEPGKDLPLIVSHGLDRQGRERRALTAGGES